MQSQLGERGLTRNLVVGAGAAAGILAFDLLYDLPRFFSITSKQFWTIAIFVLCGSVLLWGWYLLRSARRSTSRKLVWRDEDLPRGIRHCVADLASLSEPVRINALHEIQGRVKRGDIEVAAVGAILEAFLRERASVSSIDHDESDLRVDGPSPEIADSEVDGSDRDHHVARRADIEIAIRMLSEVAVFIDRPIELIDLDLHAVDLAGVDLSGFQLNGSDLYKANLAGANLSRANLSDSYLGFVEASGAIFDGAILNNVNFENSLLNNAKFSQVFSVGGRFDHVYAASVDLTRSLIAGASFRSSSIRNADIREAHVVDSSFANSDLVDVNFKGATFDSFVDFTGTHMDSGSLAGASVRLVEGYSSSLVAMTDLGATVRPILSRELGEGGGSNG